MFDFSDLTPEQVAFIKGLKPEQQESALRMILETKRLREKNRELAASIPARGITVPKKSKYWNPEKTRRA